MFRFAAAPLVAMGSLVASGASAQSQPAIMVVDTDRTYAECRACKAALAELEARRTTFEQQLQRSRTELDALETQINADGAAIEAMNESAREAANGALRQKISKYTDLAQGLEKQREALAQALKQAQTSVLEQIDARLREIVKEVRAARGATIMVQSGSVLAYDPAADVTAEVIQRLDATLQSVTLPPAPS